MSTAQWFVLVAAFLGWMFDGVEMGLFAAVARPAMQDLLRGASEVRIQAYIAYVTAAFLLGAACGGALFGWLGDRIGRVRAMVLSILAYSVFTGTCYFAIAPWQLGGLRFLASLGMGGEWALGVALVVECWPDRFRPILAGTIGAAGNAGYLLIGLILMRFPATPDSWRWTMLVCTAPAGLALGIAAFLPESPRWERSVQGAGAKPIREIFTTRLIGPTLIATTLSSVALIGTWGCAQAFLPAWADWMGERLVPPNPFAKATTLAAVALGAMLGSLIGPLVGGRIGRRPAYFGMCAASFLVCQFIFRESNRYDATFLLLAGATGCCTASFYGWLPLYLPELFPTRVRATGQGLCYNFGRVFAMIGVLQAGRLMAFFDGSYPRACAAMSLIYLVGMAVIWLAPETRGRPLPE
ncbi:MAG: MFS transporter [Thermoguttaceae bacterium]